MSNIQSALPEDLRFHFQISQEIDAFRQRCADILGKHENTNVFTRSRYPLAYESIFCEKIFSNYFGFWIVVTSIHYVDLVKTSPICISPQPSRQPGLTRPGEIWDHRLQMRSRTPVSRRLNSCSSSLRLFFRLILVCIKPWFQWLEHKSEALAEHYKIDPAFVWNLIRKLGLTKETPRESKQTPSLHPRSRFGASPLGSKNESK